MNLARKLIALAFAAVSVTVTAHDLRGGSADAAAPAEYEYAPPPVETDVETLWNELAAEAAFMQVQIAESRSLAQCKSECNNCRNCNRGRCRQNCEQIYDKGGGSSGRTNSCGDCYKFGPGNRRNRCLDSCRQARDDNSNKSSCRRCNDIRSASARRDCKNRNCSAETLEKLNFVEAMEMLSEYDDSADYDSADE